MGFKDDFKREMRNVVKDVEYETVNRSGLIYRVNLLAPV